MAQSVKHILAKAVLLAVALAIACAPAGRAASVSGPGWPVGQAPPDTLEPTGRPGRGVPQASGWRDTFDDESAFADMMRTAVSAGAVALTQIRPAAYHAQLCILSLTVGSDARIYVGGCGPSLYVYDPSTGGMTNLGAPAPDEPT
jgi:opacity protein-like surface antigen